MIEIKVSSDRDRGAREGGALVGGPGAAPSRRQASRTRTRWSAWPTRTPTARSTPLHRLDDPEDVAERVGTDIDLGFTDLVFHFPGNEQARYMEEFARDVLPLLRGRVPAEVASRGRPPQGARRLRRRGLALRARFLADVGAHPTRAGRVRARPRASRGIDFLEVARYNDESGSAPIPSGYSEVVFGEAFRASGWPRDEVTIGEKLWWEHWPRAEPVGRSSTSRSSARDSTTSTSSSATRRRPTSRWRTSSG